MKRTHRAKNLRHEGRLIPIDEKIVPLIRATWALGFKTYFSCQNQPPGHIYYRKYSGRWVMLKMPANDAARWARIALPNFVRWEKREPIFMGDKTMCWKFTAWPTTSHPLTFDIFIYFRWSELPRVVSNLLAAGGKGAMK